MTIREYSSARIGSTWTYGDHENLCAVIRQVEKLADSLITLARHDAAKRAPAAPEQQSFDSLKAAASGDRE